MSRPTTPERSSPSTPILSSARRVLTLPTKLDSHARNRPTAPIDDDSSKPLLTLPSAKIISFKPDSARPASSQSASSSGSHYDDVLPWTMPTESLKAEGPLKVYRAPSTGTFFLECSNFRKPILQRTQCWTVDRDTRIILKFEGYYRVELPSAESEQMQRNELRVVLSNLCQFEETPCPFRPGYRPVSQEPATPGRRQSLITPRAKKWRLNGVWEPEDAERRAEFQEKNRRQSEEVQQRRRQSLHAKISDRWTTSRLSSLTSTSTANAPGRASTFGTIRPSQVTLMPAPTPETVKASRSSGSRVDIPRRFSEHLAKAGPPEASLPSQTPAQSPLDAQELSTPHIVVEEDSSTANSHLDRAPDSETISFKSSTDSFHSTVDILDIEPEPLLLSPSGFSLHSHTSSNGTFVPLTPRGADDLPWTPTIADLQPSDDIQSINSDHGGEEAEHATPIAQALRRRKIPLVYPPDQTPVSYKPKPPTTTQVIIPLTPKAVGGIVLRKTFAILLNSSISLMALLIKIAQHVLKQSKSRSVHHQRQRSVPGAWDDVLQDDETDYEDALEVDDFDHPISGLASRANLASKSRESLQVLSRSVSAGSARRHDEWSVD